MSRTTTDAQHNGPAGGPWAAADADALRPGPLGRVAGWTFRHRGRTVLVWVAALALAAGLSAAFAGAFSADYTAPGSDSRQAQDLLAARFPAQSGDTISVVVRSAGPVTAPATRADVEGLLERMRQQPHVVGVQSPYGASGSVSPDGHTALGQLRLDVANGANMPVADTQRLIAMAHAAEHSGLQVALGGQSIEQEQQGQIGSEGFGLLAAALILLLTFGSVVAAGLPIAVALAGLGVSSALTGLVAAVMPVPDWSTSLATMIGLGVGIDYALLMVTRFREWRAEGLDPQTATVATLDTAGRSVLLAGGTVVVSMLGLFAMGLSFMRGAAVVTIVAVLVVMLAAITLFPALLGYLGPRIDRWRIPLPRRRAASSAGPRGWLRWSRLIERHARVATLLGVAVLLLLASPFLGTRFGFPDAGNDAAGSSGRTAYTMTADGFGPGANGPLLVVAELPARGTPGSDVGALARLGSDLRTVPGVAAVTAPQLSPAGDTAVLTVLPTTGPQSTATQDLVRDLRDHVIPTATAGTGLVVHVGGVTASSIDSTSNIAKRIPLLIGGVVLLSMLLLLVSFRSVAIALKAAAMNLLSVGAAYGVVALVLQGGWAGRLVGIDNPTPLPAFVPVLMFAVLFGLSMDYEVFLVARMREAWLRTGDNSTAIVQGLAGTARVITAAAAIMIAVFSAFIPSSLVVLKVIGIGMAAAILIDATVVRMLLVPAVMHLLGARNWWLPAWLDRRIPQVHVEGHPDQYRVGSTPAVPAATPAGYPDAALV
jgi:putative drug exporter of the RND superfamily